MILSKLAFLHLTLIKTGRTQFRCYVFQNLLGIGFGRFWSCISLSYENQILDASPAFAGHPISKDSILSLFSFLLPKNLTSLKAFHSPRLRKCRMTNQLISNDCDVTILMTNRQKNLFSKIEET